MTRENLPTLALNLLQRLIATPSFSKEEDEVASIIEDFFEQVLK